MSTVKGSETVTQYLPLWYKNKVTTKTNSNVASVESKSGPSQMSKDNKMSLKLKLDSLEK